MKKILIYGDVDLNLIDGSSVWLVNLARLLSMDEEIMVDILLKMLSPQRQIIAVDGDAEKIDIASHNYLCAPGLEFICADPDTAGTSDFDAVILPDWTVVHPCSGIARQSSDDGRS